MSTVTVQVTLVGDNYWSYRQGDGGEAHDGGQGTEAVHSVHGLVTVHMVILLYSLLVRHMIKDSAKPIDI